MIPVVSRPNEDLALIERCLAPLKFVADGQYQRRYDEALAALARVQARQQELEDALRRVPKPWNPAPEDRLSNMHYISDETCAAIWAALAVSGGRESETG